MNEIIRTILRCCSIIIGLIFIVISFIFLLITIPFLFCGIIPGIISFICAVGSIGVASLFFAAAGWQTHKEKVNTDAHLKLKDIQLKLKDENYKAEVDIAMKELENC